MNSSKVLPFLFLGLLSLFAGCRPIQTTGTNSTSANADSAATTQTVAAPLPDSGFKAAITLPDPPTKLRTGEVRFINIVVRNISNTVWWQRGGVTNDRTDNKYYIAAGNRWLDKDGKMTSETEGHNGIPKDLRPGEETQMALHITAPKQPGEWIMELDMVQEGVSWFSEKGSPTTKVKVQVVR